MMFVLVHQGRFNVESSNNPVDCGPALQTVNIYWVYRLHVKMLLIGLLYR